MRFDDHGHAVLSPREIHNQLLKSRRWLINSVLIPAVPAVFPTRESHENFVEWLSDELRVHPRNFVVRGSTLLGFSLQPNLDKVWVSMSPTSDIDLAIVDADYYQVIDREVRHLESHRDRQIRGETDRKRERRRQHRRFYCYRYFDLPEIPAVAHQKDVIRRVPTSLLNEPRTLNAFVFRDWWSLFDRWNSDLGRLAHGLTTGELVAGDEAPRPVEPSVRREGPF